MLRASVFVFSPYRGILWARPDGIFWQVRSSLPGRRHLPRLFTLMPTTIKISFRCGATRQVARIITDRERTSRPGCARRLGRYLRAQGRASQGARVVARAWIDPAYKQRLLANGTSAIAELGYSGEQGADIRVVENTTTVHNLITCTLCSCYPWPVLGLPPVWYKSAPYRSRSVIDPRDGCANLALCCRTTSRYVFGTARRRSVTWCCQSGRRARSI
jgi:Nitrile hydratase, alpha chain